MTDPTPIPQRPWFGREPALVIQGITGFLLMLAGFGLAGLNDGLVASIAALLVAAANTYTALYVRPIAPTIFGGLIAAGATLGAAFGLDWTQQQVALVTLAAQSIVALLTRPQQRPVQTAPDGRTVVIPERGTV